jgi:hypothetical protein
LTNLDQWTELPGMKTDRTNRQDLERRIESARWLAALPIDESIRERLRRLIKELEEALKVTEGPRILNKKV